MKISTNSIFQYLRAIMLFLIILAASYNTLYAANGTNIKIDLKKVNQKNSLRINDELEFKLMAQKIDRSTSGRYENAEIKFEIPSGYEFISSNLTKLNGTTINATESNNYNSQTGIWKLSQIIYGGADADHFVLNVKLKAKDISAHKKPFQAILLKHKTDEAPLFNNLVISSDTITPSVVESFDPNDNRMFISMGNLHASSKILGLDIKVGGIDFGNLNPSPPTVGPTLNGIAYNPLDHYLYAMGRDNNNKKIYIIGKDGIPHHYGDIKIDEDIINGEIDPEGNYYIRAIGNSKNIHVIDLKTLTFKTINLDGMPGTADLAYFTPSKMLYSVSIDEGEIFKISTTGPIFNGKNYQSLGKIKTRHPLLPPPYNAISNQIIGAGTSENKNYFGALYGSNGANIFGSLNNGVGFYKIFVDERPTSIVLGKLGTAEFLGQISPADNNDGAHDVTKEVPLPADLGVVQKIKNCFIAGGTLTYQVELQNHGPLAANGSVVDFGSWLINAGIPPQNLQYKFISEGGFDKHYEYRTLDNRVDNTKAIVTQNGPFTNPVSGLIENYTTIFEVTVQLPNTVTNPLTVTTIYTPPADIIDPTPNVFPNTATDILNVAMNVNGVGINKNSMCFGDAAPILLNPDNIPGTWTSSNPAIATVTAGGIVTILTVGEVSFQFTPTLASDCLPTPESFSIINRPVKPIFANTTQPTCPEPTSGSITIDGSVAGDFSYTLRGTNQGNNYLKTQVELVFNNLGSGTYELTRNSGTTECVSEAVIVTINPVPGAPDKPNGIVVNIDCVILSGSITVSNPIDGITYSLIDRKDTTKVFTAVNFKFSNLPVSDYILRATNVGLCSNDREFSITDIITPDKPEAEAFQPTCLVSFGKIQVKDVNPLFVYSLSGGNLSTPLTGTVFENLNPATYQLTATLANCVSAKTPVTINPQPVTPLTPTADVIQPNCNVATGTITVTNPLENYIYTLGGDQLQVPLNGLVFRNLNPGQYRLTATLGVCSSPVAQFTVLPQPVTPATPALTITDINCVIKVGKIEITNPENGVIYKLTGNGLAAEGIEGLIFDNLNAGTYTVTAIHTIGNCTSFTIATIASNIAPPTVVVGTPFTKSCKVNQNGLMIGGEPVEGFSYSWLPTAGLSNPNIANPIANPNTTTKYELTVLNLSTQCEAKGEITITVDTNVTPLLTVEAAKCLGNGQYSFEFYSNGTVTAVGGTIQGNVVTANIGTNVVLTATNPNACATSTQTVISPENCDEPCDFEMGAGQPVCAGDGTYSVAINFSAGVQLAVNAGTISGNSVINIPLGTDLILTGTFGDCNRKIQVTALTNCEIICDQAAISLSAPKCEGTTYSVNFSNPNLAAIQVSSGTISGNSIIGIPMGTSVVVTATLPNGCLSQVLTIDPPKTVPPLLTAQAATCLGNNQYTFKFYSNGNVTAIGGTINGNVVTGTIGTAVRLISTAKSGCGTTELIINSPVNCDPPCAVELSSGQPVCDANGNYQVSINFTAGATITTSAGVLNGNMITNIPLGTDVTITATIGNCTKTITVIGIKVCPPCGERAVISVSAGICEGTTYRVNFSNPNQAVLTISAGTISGNSIIGIPMGTPLTIKAFLCIEQEITIDSPPNNIPLLTTEAAKCNGDGTYTFNFYSNGNVVATGGTISGYTVTATIGTSVELVSTAYVGCGSSKLTVISPENCDTPCALILSAGQPVCSGNGTYAVSLNYTMGAQITVSAGTLNGFKLTNIPLGTDVKVTAILGDCKREILITAILTCDVECGQALVSYSAGICDGAFYKINVTNPNGATITATAGTVTADAIINIPVGTAVTITATSANACEPQIITIQSPNCPSISLVKTGKFNDENKDGFASVGETITYTFVITNTGNVVLNNITLQDLLPGIAIKSGSGPFTLNPGESKSDLFTATYVIRQSDLDAQKVFNEATVSGTTPSGEIVTGKSDFTVVIKENPDCAITIFNVLTPNGDGKNEYFKIEGIDCYADNNVKIFNRWGVLVFERDGYNNQDKSFKGYSEGRTTINSNEKLPTGVYFYILKYKDSTGVSRSKSGYIYLSL